MNDKPSRVREASGAIIIDCLGRFLLQQRDDVVGISNPGKIGLFGGRSEADETPLQCIVREVHEELSYFIPPERFERVGSFDVEEGSLRAHLFVARGVPAADLVVTEGKLLIVEPANIDQIASRLAPTTHFALEAYLKQFKSRL